MAIDDVALGELLLDPDRFPWDRFLFLPRGAEWTLETKGAVLHEEDLDVEPPEAELANGMRYALSISQVCEIVENARQQRARPSAGDLLRAFQYYFDHDAFITFP